jgi:hypothetical protein
MATWNETELANAVLTQLGVLASGQSAAAEDAKVVTDTWSSVYQQLRRHQLAPFSSSAIDEEFQEPLAKYMAGQVYVKFGITGPREQSISADAMRGWQQLQEQAGSDKSVSSVRPRFY